jgi:hypothetical protein
MGVVAADFDGDGYEDLYVTCLGPNHLYHNNHDGTFTDVTEKAGVDDPRWSTGAAFGDYDNDGALDLFVANYVDFKLSDLPQFGKGKFCRYRGVPVQCGPRGLPGAGDSLFHNNCDGTFTNVTQKAGVADPGGRYGLGVVWTDFDDDGWQDLYLANDAGPELPLSQQSLSQSWRRSGRQTGRLRNRRTAGCGAARTTHIEHGAPSLSERGKLSHDQDHLPLPYRGKAGAAAARRIGRLSQDFRQVLTTDGLAVNAREPPPQQRRRPTGDLHADSYVPLAATATWSRILATLPASVAPRITKGAFVLGSIPQ